MSRTLEVLKRFVMSVRDQRTSVSGIRVSNCNNRGYPYDHTVKIMFSFSDALTDGYLLNTLKGAGLYKDDTISIQLVDEPEIQTCELEKVPNSGVSSLTVELTREVAAATSTSIIKTLRAETIFGVPFELYKGYSISQLEVFFGASRIPLEIKNNSDSSTYSYQGLPLIVEYLSDGGEIRFFYVNEHGQLIKSLHQISEYATEGIKQRLFRHNYKPKSGILINAGFTNGSHFGNPPLLEWPSLVQMVTEKISNELDENTLNQVSRISERISSVGNRPRIKFGHHDLGLRPVNEVETVLLFQKAASLPGFRFPDGLKVEILDYSPKDIDSICRIQLTPAHPEETGPVEFEFELRSFFKHGHDHRQVKLIICYTARPLQFPYNFGGIAYRLDYSSGLPRLSNSEDHSAVPCLILDELFNI